MKHKDYMKSLEKDAKNYRKGIAFSVVATFLVLTLTLAVTVVGGLVVGIMSLVNKGGGEKPVITINPAFEEDGAAVGFLGEAPMFKKLVRITDDKDEDFTYDIKDNVDITKLGEYEVRYTITDSDGNTSYFKLKYRVVKDDGYTKTRLMKLVAEKAQELGISEGLSKKQKVQKIYNYAHSKGTIAFTDVSNIPDIDRDNWKKDWIEEAIRTIDPEEGTNEGDCYSYYSVSKAFFEYFGIDNYGVKRSEDCELDGTHFWSAVEVEEGWYFYDATRLAGNFTDGSANACLVTRATLESHRTSKGEKGFYLMDDDPNMPDIETKKIG